MKGRADLTTCQNCGAELHGPFCHACGQRDVDLRTNVFALFQEWGSNMVRLDGRLLRTLPGFLLHPHRLARAYVDGKRHRFTPPMRLILTVFSIGVVILLLATRVTVDELAESAQIREDGTYAMEAAGMKQQITFDLRPDSTLGKKIARLETETDPAFATRTLIQLALRSTSLATMLCIPILALLLRLVNRRTYLVEHLLFSALLHGGVFLLFAAGSLVFASLAGLFLLLVPVQVARHQWALNPGHHGWNALKVVFVLGVHLVASWFAYLTAYMVGLYGL